MLVFIGSDCVEHNMPFFGQLLLLCNDFYQCLFVANEIEPLTQIIDCRVEEVVPAILVVDHLILFLSIFGPWPLFVFHNNSRTVSYPMDPCWGLTSFITKYPMSFWFCQIIMYVRILTIFSTTYNTFVYVVIISGIWVSLFTGLQKNIRVLLFTPNHSFTGP